MPQVKSLPVKFKTGAEAGLNEGEFLVYPSTFTRTPDSYGDIIAPGAFAADIARRKESGAVLPGLFGHRMDDPHMFVASALDEGEDEHGWWVKGVFDLGEPTADKVYRLVKSGRIRELSFAFDVRSSGDVELEGGEKAHELRELEVFEFTFTPVGANRDTSVVAVKSAAAALAVGLKAGQVLTSKNQDALNSAVATLEETIAVIKAVIADNDSGDEDEPAAGGDGGEDESANGAKSGDLGVPTPGATAIAFRVQMLALSAGL